MEENYTYLHKLNLLTKIEYYNIYSIKNSNVMVFLEVEDKTELLQLSGCACCFDDLE